MAPASMRAHRLALPLALPMVFLLTAPAGLAAQDFHVSPFTSRDGGLRGAPPLVGLGATVYSGAFGFRASGAMDAPSSPLAPALGYGPSPAVQAWAADVDLVLSGARLGIVAGNVEPSVFTGFGLHGLRGWDGTTATIPVWSYGVGAATPLAKWLSLDVEARYRMPHESRPERLPADVGGGWEIRTGLSLRLGSGDAARRPSAATAGSHSGARAGAGRATRPASGAAAAAALTIRTADRYVGVPYVWGGDSPEEGFDCSGYVQYVYALNGIQLPRVSRDQSRAGQWVAPELSSLREGDLLFFAGADGVIDHVAIYVGDRTILHSSASRGAVGYDRLDSQRGRWYATHMVAARRVFGGPDTFRFSP